MKTINVQISGDSLLMNNPACMLEEEKSKGTVKKTTKKGKDYKTEAKDRLYALPNGELYVPATWIYGAMVNASAYKKVGKYSLRPILAGAVRVFPVKIGLGTKKYEIDVRTVVVNKGKARIPRARPMVEDWVCNFEITYDETMIEDDEIIRGVLEESGKRVGIGDFRPQKMGPFGTFEIDSWEHEDGPKKKKKAKAKKVEKAPKTKKAKKISVEVEVKEKPKKRGRPKKTEEKKPVAIKRKPGRPKKSA